ncbi:MAG: PH domain-containing protein [Candidatus Bathyarchaeota archaeon]|nr:PH domain-containing protein [Candidatus Bathyarchaeota archaeon]
MSKVFPITPASTGALYVVGIILIPLILITGLVAYSARNTSFEVNDKGFRIKGVIYGRFIPKESIIIEDSRIVNLNVEREFKPIRRTNGIGLPGYSEGWFKLANGERALLFVTDRFNVVYMPTTEGYSVLLSTVYPEEFLESLNEEWNGY